MTDFPLGLLVRGDPSQPRLLCDWRAAFDACCTCAPGAPVGTEAYLSAFRFDEALERHMAAHSGSVRGFDGPVGASIAWADFDGPSALDDAKGVLLFAEQHFGEAVPPLVAFSGSKGYHLGIHVSPEECPPGSAFNRVVRSFWEALVRDAGASGSFDGAVFDKARILRCPNSRHPATGLHKVFLPAGDLLEMSDAQVREVAKRPRELDPADLEGGFDFALARRWTDAQRATTAHTEAQQARRDGPAKLNPSTLQFIRDGAANGERAHRVFQAAANLAECGAPAALVTALIEESALDSGLPPSEVHRQIACGVQHGGRGHG